MLRTTRAKCFLTLCVILLTFSVYIGSSVWAPAAMIGAEYFNVSLTASALGIALFVLGYGIGPLFLAPITEIPAVGRTAPYIITLLIYALLQIPNALVDNFAGFCVLRFLSGFVGSPVLATGGKFTIHKFRKIPAMLTSRCICSRRLLPREGGLRYVPLWIRCSRWTWSWTNSCSLGYRRQWLAMGLLGDAHAFRFRSHRPRCCYA